jgi:hypothetical protein
MLVMKKIFLILILSLFLAGCSQVQPEPIIVTETVIETVEVEDTRKIEELQAETRRCRNLLNNLNDLLSNVYYGYAENENWVQDGFTAFSMEYKGKYYLITAGHCVENEHGRFNGFRFKANFSDRWVYPELLAYGNVYAKEEDYAVFYSDKVNSGLQVSTEFASEKFVLGISEQNALRRMGIAIPGESGSPIINLDGEVVKIVSGSFAYTDINTVLKAIDALN